MSEGTLEERFKKLRDAGPLGSDTRITGTPEAWRPRMDIDMATGGFLVSSARAQGNTPDSSEILSEFDLDPLQWTVTNVRKSKWQTYSGDWLEAYRVSVVPVGAASGMDFDLEQLVAEIKRWKPTKGPRKISGDGAYAVVPSDQQIGKKANGEGTPESVARILEYTEGAVWRLQELRKIGRSLGTVAFCMLGDHVEGNTSQGGRLQSPAASDMGLTEQTRVARRLLLQQIKTFAPLCEQLVVAVVNGNHDEVTRQVVADPSDGWNVEIASAVQDACAENPNLEHVSFRFPSHDHQTLTVNVNGTLVGLFHGHQSGRDVVKYLSGQAAGQTALGQADMWLSGHYHHFKALDVGSRLWIQAPTTDPGSPWWRDRAGLESEPGLLTLTLGGDINPRQDISIISQSR